MVPFVKTGYLGTNQWVPLVNGNGLTAGGGEPVPEIVWVKVSGTSPLSLPGAIANSIKSLTQYGLCTQASTPTPSAPVDIMCNNGALRFGALGVNLLNPVGIVIGQNYTPEGNPSASQNNWRTGLIPIEGGKTYAFWGRRKSDNAMSAFNRINWFDADGNNISPRPSYTVNTVTVGTAPSNAAFVGLSSSCYNSSAAITQATFDEFNWMLAETDAEIPYEPFVGGIYADGTPEVLTVMANQNTDPTIVKATLASGTTEVRYNASSSCIVAPVKPNTVYTIGFLTKPTGGSIFRAATTKTKVSSSVTSVASIAYDLDMNNYATKTLNSGEDAAWMYVQLSSTMSDDDFASIIIQEGTSIHNPQTASVADLYSVGDVADEAEIISGGVTHRIGCHVFDGTETFSKSSAYGQAFLINAAYVAWGADRTKAVLCTHFLGLPQKSGNQEDNTCFFNQTGHFYFRVTDNSDINAWKAWLAEQYASGAPVIVWFVLAKNVTESVTAQPLHTADGDNTVSVTANVSPVALECEYANGYAQ